MGWGIKPNRIGTAHDGDQAQEQFRGKAELLDHGIKSASLAAAAPEHALCFDFEGSCPKSSGNRRNLPWRHGQEDGLRADETPDEPEAGDPVELGSCPRHLYGAALRIAGQQLDL